MDEVKALTMKNQPGKSLDKKKRCRCGSLGHLHITSKECPIGIYYQNKKKSSEMGLYQKEAKKEADDAFTEAQKNCFMPEESLMKDESDEE